MVSLVKYIQLSVVDECELSHCLMIDLARLLTLAQIHSTNGDYRKYS